MYKSHSASHANAFCFMEISKSAAVTDMNSTNKQINCKTNWFKKDDELMTSHPRVHLMQTGEFCC